MIDASTLKELVRLMVDNDLSELDGDGIVALSEFALGLGPSTPSLGGLPIVTNAASHLTPTFSAPIGASGVTDSVEVSDDLAAWHSGAGFTETMSDTTSAGTRTVIARDLATSAPRYIRFRVSR